MFKTNKILLILIIVLVIIVLGLAAGFLFLFGGKIGWERPYYAVYLQSGDMYFGKLSGIFNHDSLSDAWFLQRNSQDGQNPFSLTKFSNAFWGPEDKLYLNKENIIWKTKLSKDSQVVAFIKNNQNQSVVPSPVAPLQQTPEIPALTPE